MTYIIDVDIDNALVNPVDIEPFLENWIRALARDEILKNENHDPSLM